MANVLRFVKSLDHAVPPRPEPSSGLLLAAVAHAAPAEVPIVAARSNLALLEAGLSRELDVAHAITERLQSVPTQATSLPDLVKRGRRQLLKARQDARLSELDDVHGKVVGLQTSLQD